MSHSSTRFSLPGGRRALLMNLALVTGMFVAGCQGPQPAQRAPTAAPTVHVPPPVPNASGDRATRTATSTQDAAAAVLEALPTQAPAPPARVTSLDGRLLIATTRTSPRPHSDLSIDYRLAWLSSAGVQPIRLPGDERGVVDAAASRDGTQIAVIIAGDTLVRLSVDGRGALPVLSRLAPSVEHPDFYLSAAWLPGDRLLVRQTSPVGLFVIDPDGQNRRPLLKNGQQPAPSPDGNQLALGYVNNQARFYSIYVTDLAFSSLRKLTDDAVTESSAAWSPDGQWIAYAANAGYREDGLVVPNWEVRLIHPNGTGQRTLVTGHGGTTYSQIRWSPDSKNLAVTRVDELSNARRISLVSLDRNNEVLVSPGDANDTVLGWLP